ncbi:MAG: hypothetical protein LAP40_12840 [Acidobacteriia bacterium]|nr:hypothetical protein [Terriglobia bacterium]
MRISRQGLRLAAAGTLLLPALVWGPARLRAADAGQSLTSEQKEEFLRNAHIEQEKDAKKGVTQTLRITLSDGKMTHDASVQRINESKAVFQAQDGTSEFNFKDTYKFNIAAWKLARLLGIDDMTPPSVERKYRGDPAAFTWWVDDVLMDEETRSKQKASAPNTDAWNQEMYVVRVFDQLIFNTDRNLTNLLIDKQWHIWMIDHSRAFRMRHDLRESKNLVQCDRNLLAKMKTLDQATLKKELTPYLNGEEIKGLLARRDAIVKFFEAKGESALYNRPPRT